MAYTTALHLVATEKLKGKGKGERLLGIDYHWSDVQASDGDFVCVGNAVRRGVNVFGHSRDGLDGSLGVCLSR